MFGGSGRFVHVHHRVEVKTGLQILLCHLNALGIEIKALCRNWFVSTKGNLANLEAIEQAGPPVESFENVPECGCCPSVVGSRLQVGGRWGKHQRHARNGCGLPLETRSRKSLTDEFAVVSEILAYSANATRNDPFGFDTRLYCRRKRQGHGPDRGSVVRLYR